MSRTYDLVCRSCNKYIWIGQGWPATKTYIYKDNDHLQLLETFLFEHQEHDLVFADSEALDGIVDMDDLEEIEIKVKDVKDGK